MKKMLYAAANIILSIFFISCKDTTNEPTDNIPDSGKYIFYTNILPGDPVKAEIRRYNTEAGKDELFKPNASLFGIANKRIYYFDITYPSLRIKSMNCDAAGNDTKQLLSENKDKYLNCVISPDGSKILYYRAEEEQSEFEIHCADLDGSNDKLIYIASGLFGYEGEPMAAFSADSKKIGISDKQYDAVYLFTCNSDGSDYRQQKYVHGFGYMYGCLSPDGSSFAYSSLEGFDYNIEFDSSNIAVYNMNTQENKVLTSDGIISYMPVWSPDGSRLAFFRQPGKLCIINADGTNLRQAGCNGSIFTQYSWWLHLKISWSPDGEKVLFMVTNAEDYNTTDLYILDASSMKLTTVISKGSFYNAFWY